MKKHLDQAFLAKKIHFHCYKFIAAWWRQSFFRSTKLRKGKIKGCGDKPKGFPYVTEPSALALVKKKGIHRKH